MPDAPVFDLATLDSCCGLRPGMTRAEVLDVLKRQNLEAVEDDPETLFVSGDEWELNLHFATDGTQRLRHISIDIGEILWNGRPLIELRVDDAWRLMGSPATMVWQLGDQIGDPFKETPIDPTQPPTDEKLMEEGTLWLPERGLGLVIGNGEVMGAVWREARDLPQHLAGPLTESQRALSMRPDLGDYLLEKRLARRKIEATRDPAAWPRRILAIAVIVAFAVVGKKAFDDTQLWNQAPTLQAKYLNLERVPMKQFRDYVPPALRWIFPRTKAVVVDAYRVEFRPPGEDALQQAVLERGELYVWPEKPGDEVPICYLPGPPPRTVGLRHARDAAFLDYVPWIVAIGALWLLLFILSGLLPLVLRLVLRLARRLAPSGVSKDPDRPELR